MKIATFNVQNMRLRQICGVMRLDGARDSDIEADADAFATVLDPIDRQLTAQVLRNADADVVVLQEVFDQRTLDYFHDAFLVPAGIQPYPHRVCMPGNDGRGFNVAIMSRTPYMRVASHAAITPRDLGLAPLEEVGPDCRILRRDCLEADIGPITIYGCHFKAPYPHPERAWRIRRMEATAVAAIIRRRFGADPTARWLVVGDLNEPGGEPSIDGLATAPLRAPFGFDLLQRLPRSERWSFHEPGSQKYTLPDAIIASPMLAQQNAEAKPRVIRTGLDREARLYKGRRLRGVGRHRPHASDHAAIVVSLRNI